MNDFFEKTDLTRTKAEKIIDETLLNKDDGELYLQNSINENITLDDGKIKNIFNNIILANDLEFKYSKNCPTALITEGLIVGGC